ncbi:Phophatidylserine decarboxylase-domain-containing protein [Pisolithus albus]|nr:Phophatidylserine decarboxylase-domain-containing protein [Pisolithus albus]
MSETIVCRWFPEDPAVDDAYVHDLLCTSRLIHGHHPDTSEPFANVGEDLRLRLSNSIVRALHPVVKEFKESIETEGAVYAAFNKMFQRAPKPNNDQQRKIANYTELMDAINTNLATAPTYRPGPGATVAGVPSYGIIARFCNIDAGYEAFTDPGVNQTRYLTSSASPNVIDDREDGWLNTVALNAMVQSAGGNPKQDTFDFYICDTSGPHYGFKSYDELFVRELKECHRTVVFPEDLSIVDSACSSTVHKLYCGLKEMDEFWTKKTSYAATSSQATSEQSTPLAGLYPCYAWISRLPPLAEPCERYRGATHPNPPPTYYSQEPCDVLVGAVALHIHDVKQVRSFPKIFALVVDAIAGLYDSQSPPLHLRKRLERLPLICCQHGRASAAVSMVCGITRNSPKYFLPTFFRGLCAKLLRHRQFQSGVKARAVVKSLYSSIAHPLLHMIANSATRAEATRVAEGFHGQLNRSFRLPSKRRIPRDFASLKLSSFLYNLCHKDSTFDYLFGDLSKSGRAGAAKHIFARVLTASSSCRTDLGNPLLHGVTVSTQPTPRNCHQLRKLLSLIEDLTRECGFRPDRVAVNIIIRATISWRPVFDNVRLRALFNHLIGGGYRRGDYSSQTLPFEFPSAGRPLVT